MVCRRYSLSLSKGCASSYTDFSSGNLGNILSNALLFFSLTTSSKLFVVVTRFLFIMPNTEVMRCWSNKAGAVLVTSGLHFDDDFD